MRKIRPDLVRTPPTKEVRNVYSDTPAATPFAEPMPIASEDRRPSDSPPKPNRQSIFQLSPVPATLPMPSISSIHATFQSPADDSEVEDVRRGPSHSRSAQPIPIKSNGQYRHGSHPGLLRNDSDSIPRSIPRSLIDVHMASPSSSPIVSEMKRPAAMDRPSEPVSQSINMHDSNTLSRRPGGASRRPSVSHGLGPDFEPQRLVWKAELRGLLGQECSDNEGPSLHPAESDRKPPPRTISPPRQVPPRRTTSPETRRSASPTSSVPVTRQPSPVSYSSASDPISEKERLQSTLLQRPKEAISRASDAALQAERERAGRRLLQEKLQSAAAATPQPYSAAPTYKESALQRDISSTYYTQPQHQASSQYSSSRPAFSRRPSDTSSTRKPVSTQPVNPSALTRSIWSSDQHAQRV